jgi:hypothetical protein
MKLNSYCVYNFRSVKDSGWVDCSEITTLVGVNESGKTNMLKALWKFNPVREGEIDILHDMPVTMLSELRNKTEEVKFISVKFDVDEDDNENLQELTNMEIEGLDYVIVSRYYDGHYQVSFPKEFKKTNIENENMENECITLPQAIIRIMPKFVYYSNYGNLSSKIYLPHALKWIKGEKVQGIDTNEEQVRTLKVLFDFVKLDPQEIMELGRDPKVIAMQRNKNVTEASSEEIKKAENDKEKRSILLQSAGAYLTKEFKNWWKQGEYRFRFEADGDYFHIWVSDEKRTEEVPLELRSTGLQWFLSFYLIFLMESQNENKNAILLLDEAGLTLHPLAQRDLVSFFENLSVNNQIINTTHSPFIIDSANIDWCRVVYVDGSGYTVVSSDLRQGADKLNEKSVYAVHAAMGLGVSDVLLQGCQAVIVEGASDQYYLNAIKIFLIKEKMFAPNQELVFMPSGGVKGIAGIVSMVSSKSGDLPYVVVDADKSGEDAKKKLSGALYKGNEKKIIDIGIFTSKENAEIEDIIPFRYQKRSINRLFNKLEDVYFEDIYDPQKGLVNQVEYFAENNNIELPKGWKVDVAKDVKRQIKTMKKTDVEDEYVQIWKKLFSMLNK